MPYKLRKAPKRDLYWVVSEDGSKHSKDPMPRVRAEAQIRALYANVKDLKGSAIPPKSDIQKIAKASYDKAPPDNIGDSVLIKSTPTLKFYKNGDTIIVAVRGTADTADWTKNNVFIPTNSLKSGSRYGADEAVIREVQRQYPHDQYHYYGVGHSLGGALLDEFIEAGLIDNGLSYNPAVQPKEFNKTESKNERIYNSGDALYQSMGKRLKSNPEVRENKKDNNSWFSKLARIIPGATGSLVSTANDYLDAHKLDRFEGGRRPHTHRHKLIGMGFFGNIWSAVKKVGTQVAQKLLLPKITPYVAPVAKAFSAITNIFVPHGYSPANKKWLEQNGAGVIKSIEVRRTPVGKAINGAFNIITAGKWEESKKKQGYDSVFHLAMVITYDLAGQSKRAVLEKNDTLNFTSTIKDYPGTESVNVSVSTPLTIIDAVNATQKAMGAKYFTYSAFNNNCQNFVAGFLNANNLMTPTVSSFVLQPVSNLLSEQPTYTEDFAQGITNLGGITDRFKQGYGRANHHKLKPVMIGGRKMVSLEVDG